MSQNSKTLFNNLSPSDKQLAIDNASELKRQSEVYASKVVHDLYFLTCNENPSIKAALDKLLPYDKKGFFLGSFPNFDDRPVIQLHIVPHDYQLDLFSPAAYTQTIYNSLAFILQCAQMYHITMIQTNPTLFDTMRTIRPDVNFTTLNTDPDNKSTLYFDKQLPWRIGVTCIWIDPNNKIIGTPTPLKRPPPSIDDVYVAPPTKKKHD